MMITVKKIVRMVSFSCLWHKISICKNRNGFLVHEAIYRPEHSVETDFPVEKSFIFVER